MKFCSAATRADYFRSHRNVIHDLNKCNNTSLSRGTPSCQLYIDTFRGNGFTGWPMSQCEKSRNTITCAPAVRRLREYRFQSGKYGVSSWSGTEPPDVREVGIDGSTLPRIPSRIIPMMDTMTSTFFMAYLLCRYNDCEHRQSLR